ncbi:uncharacterized protein LOC114389314 [Glycine soja]|uniref:uncharacterized protein LOC114389314 n=1 Tax=Glycine soja TaxID=3848 RepID=UPI00103E087C|nr:uncharacterized protein LOC114389314 [Glycine soja]
MFHNVFLSTIATNSVWPEFSGFKEAVREMGTDFSMIQKTFFADKRRHQIKLKCKKEERQQPLQLTDVVNNSAKDHPRSKLFIELLKVVSTKAEEYPSRDASDFVMAEEVVDLTVGTHVCTFGLFNLSFDIFLFLVQIIYDFSGLFIREIFLIA